MLIAAGSDSGTTGRHLCNQQSRCHKRAAATAATPARRIGTMRGHMRACGQCHEGSREHWAPAQALSKPTRPSPGPRARRRQAPAAARDALPMGGPERWPRASGGARRAAWSPNPTARCAPAQPCATRAADQRATRADPPQRRLQGRVGTTYAARWADPAGPAAVVRISEKGKQLMGITRFHLDLGSKPDLGLTWARIQPYESATRKS